MLLNGKTLILKGVLYKEAQSKKKEINNKRIKWIIFDFSNPFFFYKETFHYRIEEKQTFKHSKIQAI